MAVPWVFLAVIVRLVLHYRSAGCLGVEAGPVWLVPIRDFLTLLEWGAAFISRQVNWKGQELKIGRGDGIDPVQDPDP